jgi:hypothetical protein
MRRYQGRVMLTWLRKLLRQDGARADDGPVAPVATAEGRAAHHVRHEPTEAESLSQLDAFIARLVAAGYETPEEILRSAEDYLADDLDPQRIRVESGPMLQRALAAHAEDETSWPALTDCDRLDAAFAALERKGIIARQNFSCCGTCGSSEIWGEIDAARDTGKLAEGYAFFHMQDTENAADGGGLYLNYGAVDEGEAAAIAVAHVIVAEIEAKGLHTDWTGSWDQRIGVSLDWKRRRNRDAASASTTLH